MTQNLTGSSVCSTTLSTEDARTLGRDLQNQVQVPESVGAGSSPLHPTQTLRDTSAATSHPHLTSQWHQVACAPGLWVRPQPLMERASCPLPKLTPSHALECRSAAHRDSRGRVKQVSRSRPPAWASTAHTAAGRNSGLHAAVERSPRSS